MVAVDVRAERLGLRRLAHEEDCARVDEVLHQPVDGEQEAEDDDEPRDQTQAARAVNEGERGGEVDDESGEFGEHHARRVRVVREGARRLDREKRRAHVLRGAAAQGEELYETDSEEAEEWQLQKVSAHA